MAAPFFSTPFQPYVYQSPQEAVTPFQILGGEAQIVQIMLKPQEKVIAKPGSMCYMSGSIQMENVYIPENEAGLWQWLFGKSVTSIVLHNTGSSDGFVGIAAPSLARILPIDLAMFGSELLCQPDAFLCSINDVKVTNTVDQRARNVIAGAEGVLRQKLSGQGLAFIGAGGSVVQKNLEVGEVLAVDVSCIVALSSAVNVQVKYNSPMRRVVFGGDNLATAVLTGPGIVFIQSLPFHRLSQRIARAVTSPNMRENPKLFIQIAMFFFIAYVVIVSSLILTDVYFTCAFGFFSILFYFLSLSIEPIDRRSLLSPEKKTTVHNSKMKIFVKTLKGTHFEIEVKREDTVADVKKNIEAIQGADVYPAVQQMLIHQGKVLKDGTTLEENKVAENSFVVIMLTKNKGSSGEGSTASTPTVSKAPQTSAPPSTATPQAPAATTELPARALPEAAPASVTTASESDVYGQAASNLVAGSNLEGTIQQILDMGGGTWDRDTVVRALRAAFNNPERAVEYLYSGIPEQTEVPAVARAPASGPPVISPVQPAQAAAVPSSGPNANPLDLFPQGLPNLGSNAAGAGSLDFLRNSQQFQALRAMVQANPQILQPMLQELGKQNPHLMRLIQEHQADFLRLINEPVEGGEGNILGQLAAAMPQSVTVTPEEREAIERLEAMGFDRAIVLEVFFACNKNEELAANYLLDHMHEFEE